MPGPGKERGRPFAAAFFIHVQTSRRGKTAAVAPPVVLLQRFFPVDADCEVRCVWAELGGEFTADLIKALASCNACIVRPHGQELC